MAHWRIAVVVEVEAPDDADDNALTQQGYALASAVREVWTSEFDAQHWGGELGLIPDR